MELYKLGKIVSVGKTYVILESSSTGHIVYVAKASDWEEEKDKSRKVFLYLHKTEYIEALYGFKTFAERILFEDLLSVNGIGPKTALSLLKEGEEVVSSLIATGDYKSLSEVPQMGIKSANQIIFELKPKYEKRNIKLETNNSTIELRSSLKILGFNQRQIDYAAANVKVTGSIDQLIEEAIRVISSAKFA